MAIAQYNVGLEWNNAPGGPGVNSWHIRYQSADGGELGAAAAALRAFYVSCQSFFPSGVVIRFPDTAVTVGDSPTFVHVNPPAVVNANGSGGYAPLSSAVVVGWRTTAATRSGRGRTFLGPLGKGTIDSDGTPVPDVLNGIQAAAATLISASLNDNGWAFGVYSKKDGVIRDFTSARVRDVFAVLRSRRS